MRLSIITLFLIFCSSIFAEEDFRDWIRSDGKSLKGKLIDVQDGVNPETNEATKVVTIDWKIPAGNEKKGEEAEIKRIPVYLEVFAAGSQEYILDWEWTRGRTPFMERVLQVVMGEQRDIQKQRILERTLYDRIYLKDGAMAKGIVQNSTFSIYTAYSFFSLHQRSLAALQFADESVSLDQVITVNNNRFSGFVSLPEDSASGSEENFLTYVSDTGQTEKIRKEMISKIIFQVREDELTGIDAKRRAGAKSVFVRLKNGDYFDAKIDEGQFSINANGREVKVPAADVNRVEIAGKNRAQTMILKNNGGKEIGFISNEDMSVALDSGPDLKIYRERLDLVYCEDGFRPMGTIIEVAEEKNARLSISADPGGKPFGVVSRVSSSSPFMDILQPDDKIVSVNQLIPDFESKDDSYELAQEAMFEEKTIPYIVLGVQRGEQFFQVTVLSTQVN